MTDIDLDNVIKETRKAVRTLSEIDIDDKFAEVSIGKILDEIHTEAECMTTSTDKIRAPKSIEAVSANDLKTVKYLRLVDQKLRKWNIYEEYIRPKMKERTGNAHDRKILDGKELLKFEGEEFVELIYKSILKREVDEQGKRNALQCLDLIGTDKVDLIYSLVNSEEGRRKNIHVKGIWGRRSYLSIKRKIFNIPVIGYFIRLGINICLLPRRLRTFQNAFNGISSKFSALDKQCYEIGKSIDGFSMTINELKQFKSDLIDLDTYNSNRVKFEKDLIDKFYIRYNEVLMPDSREDVKNRARVYIDKINNYFINIEKSDIIAVDLGCGECEWVELLCEEGIKAIGVDSNSYVINKVRKTLPQIVIKEADALTYLKSLEDNSIDILSSLHMVEHLEMIEIIGLLEECKRVLKSGGLLIFETPNPQNILTSSYYFYMDPTHKKPIPPELLAFFIDESGLHVREKLLLYPLDFIPFEYREDDPLRHIVFRFNMEQAYSILAVKEK